MLGSLPISEGCQLLSAANRSCSASKVMNTKNDSRRKSFPAGGLSYVANGEIGVVVGQLQDAEHARSTVVDPGGFSPSPPRSDSSTTGGRQPRYRRWRIATT